MIVIDYKYFYVQILEYSAINYKPYSLPPPPLLLKKCIFSSFIYKDK
jgi:hypothetical protein